MQDDLSVLLIADFGSYLNLAAHRISCAQTLQNDHSLITEGGLDMKETTMNYDGNDKIYYDICKPAFNSQLNYILPPGRETLQAISHKNVPFLTIFGPPAVPKNNPAQITAARRRSSQTTRR